MKRFKFEYIIIIGLLIVILLMRSCYSCKIKKLSNIKSDTTTLVETKFDTVEIKIPVYIPKPYKVEITKPDSFYHKVDTGAILRDYYASYYYNDSLINDSFKLWISDIIAENKIFQRQINYKIRHRNTTVTNTILKEKWSPKRQLFYGFGIGFQQTGFNYFGGELLYENKKGQAYGLSLGINNNIDMVGKTTFLWKVGK